MHLQTLIKFSYKFTLIFTFWPSLSFSLPSDNKQIIHVSAGSADINQQTHRGIYLGGVTLDQGTTHLRAFKAFTESDINNRLIKAMIQGDHTAQAHYWTKTDEKKPELHAYADTITYYPERHLIELIGSARVEQGAHSFQAPIITYDTEKQHVLSKQTGEARTTIIIHPEKHA